MLAYMSEDKRFLNLHEYKFAKFAVFQANTTVFQANTNASLKNMETQIGQLALAMQNQSRDSFPSDTMKNPKDCMVVTLRSGKELQGREEAKKQKNEVEIEKVNQDSMSGEREKNKAGLSDKGADERKI